MFLYGNFALRPLQVGEFMSNNEIMQFPSFTGRRMRNKKTPEGVHEGCVGVRTNYRYVEWQWKVE